MSRSSGLLALLASVAVFACAACGGARTPAAAPEANPWADYKGTYAPGGPQSEPAPAVADAKDAKPASSVSLASTAEAKDTKPAKTTKAATKASPSPSDAKSMYGMAGDSKPEELTPDAAAAPAPKKTMKKRAGAIAGKKTVAKKAAKKS